MEVRIESMVSVWDDQIPMLLINLVNTAVFARNGSEFKTAIRQLSENTDFDKFFAYWKSHSTLPLLATQNYPFWLKYD